MQFLNINHEMKMATTKTKVIQNIEKGGLMQHIDCGSRFTMTNGQRQRELTD